MFLKSFTLVGFAAVLLLSIGCSGGGVQVVPETVVVTQVVTAPPPTGTPITDLATATSLPALTDAPTGTSTPTATRAALAPTATATKTLPPQPTPTAVLVNLPPFDGGMDITQIGPNDTDPTVTDALVFEAQANDSRVGGNNGDGIARIEFYIFDGNKLVYSHTETKAAYCAFGGGDPDCNQLNLAQAKTWPGTNNKIHNGKYGLLARAITPDNHSKQADVTITIQLNATQGTVQVQIVQTGVNTNSTTVAGTLVFQAVAYDTRAGNNDGAGINNVEFFILDSGGNIVHDHKESTAKYCAFGGGEPNCNLYTFADHGNRWDNNAKTPIQPGGQYTLRAVAHAPDGTTGTAELQITLQY